jgi:NAD(P)-dependent dehydrogenase (short-subunit alcohol dehydrogenase family)
VCVDHTDAGEVAGLFARVKEEQGARLDVLVMTYGEATRLAVAQAAELRPHNVAAVSLTPGFLRSEAVLDHFGVREENWRDAIDSDPHFAASETPSASASRRRP